MAATQANADLWRTDQALDTNSLHFVFGSIDRAAVEKMAPTADTVYATLRRLTGEELARGVLLTIKIVPQWLPFDEVVEDRIVQLSSPLLIADDSGHSKDVLLLLALRRTLAQGLVDSVLQVARPYNHEMGGWRPPHAAGRIYPLRDWETLAPAVVGISAAELEAAWCSSTAATPVQ